MICWSHKQVLNGPCTFNVCANQGIYRTSPNATSVWTDNKYWLIVLCAGHECGRTWSTSHAAIDPKAKNPEDWGNWTKLTMLVTVGASACWNKQEQSHHNLGVSHLCQFIQQATSQSYKRHTEGLKINIPPYLELLWLFDILKAFQLTKANAKQTRRISPTSWKWRLQTSKNYDHANQVLNTVWKNIPWGWRVGYIYIYTFKVTSRTLQLYQHVWRRFILRRNNCPRQVKCTYTFQATVNPQ